MLARALAQAISLSRRQPASMEVNKQAIGLHLLCIAHCAALLTVPPCVGLTCSVLCQVSSTNSNKIFRDRFFLVAAHRPVFFIFSNWDINF